MSNDHLHPVMRQALAPFTPPDAREAFASELEALVAKHGKTLNDNEVISTLEEALSRAWEFAGEPQPASLFEHAPELLAALKRLLPTNINLNHPGLPDSTVLPCDVTLGEFRAAASAIAKAEGRS